MMKITYNAILTVNYDTINTVQSYQMRHLTLCVGTEEGGGNASGVLTVLNSTDLKMYQ